MSDFVPENLLQRIHRNLCRCKKRPESPVPVAIVKRDVQILVSDICARVYGDLLESFEGLDSLTGVRDGFGPGGIRSAVVLQSVAMLVPGFKQLETSMKRVPCFPAREYAREIDKLLNIRWRAVSNPDDPEFEKARVFFTSLTGELYRKGGH